MKGAHVRQRQVLNGETPEQSERDERDLRSRQREVELDVFRRACQRVLGEHPVSLSRARGGVTSFRAHKAMVITKSIRIVVFARRHLLEVVRDRPRVVIVV